MIALICTGTRHAQPAQWEAIVRTALAWHIGAGPAVVLHGDAPGIDTIAATEAARMRDVEVVAYPADWNKHPYGDPRRNQAGPERNQKMLDDLLKFREMGDEVLVLAFHDQPDLMTTKWGGTADMVRRSRRSGVRVVWFRSSGESEVWG